MALPKTLSVMHEHTAAAAAVVASLALCLGASCSSDTDATVLHGALRVPDPMMPEGESRGGTNMAEIRRRLQALGELSSIVAHAGDFNGDGHTDLYFAAAPGAPTQDVEKGNLPLGLVLAATAEGEFEFRQAEEGFEFATKTAGGEVPGASFSKIFDAGLPELATVARCYVVAGLVTLVLEHPATAELALITGLLGLATSTDGNPSRFAVCLDTEQTVLGCLAIEILDVLGRAGWSYFAPGRHCYQVPEPIAPNQCNDPNLTMDVCRKQDYASGCCNQDFVYRTIFRADVRNQAPFPILDPSTPIPEVPRRVILDGSVLLDVFDSGVNLDAHWVLGCLPGDWRLTRNPISVSSTEPCATNIALDGHFLQGRVDQCIGENQTAVHTRIIGVGEDPAMRFAGLNNDQGYELFADVARGFQGRVKVALDAIENEGLCCSGADLRGGTIALQGDSVIVTPTTSTPPQCDGACEFEACGGDPVGLWRIERECRPSGEDYFAAVPECVGSMPRAVRTTTGTVEFRADGVERGDLTEAWRYPDATFSPRCLAALGMSASDCSSIATRFYSPEQNASCGLRDGGACSCTVPGTVTSSTDELRYAVSGNRLIVSQAEGATVDPLTDPMATEFPFCVRDGALTTEGYNGEQELPANQRTIVTLTRMN